jgi:hypothetical protein
MVNGVGFRVVKVLQGGVCVVIRWFSWFLGWGGCCLRVGQLGFYYNLLRYTGLMFFLEGSSHNLINAVLLPNKGVNQFVINILNGFFECHYTVFA